MVKITTAMIPAKDVLNLNAVTSLFEKWFGRLFFFFLIITSGCLCYLRWLQSLCLLHRESPSLRLGGTLHLRSKRSLTVTHSNFQLFTAVIEQDKKKSKLHRVWHILAASSYKGRSRTWCRRIDALLVTLWSQGDGWNVLSIPQGWFMKSVSCATVLLNACQERVPANTRRVRIACCTHQLLWQLSYCCYTERADG